MTSETGQYTMKLRLQSESTPSRRYALLLYRKHFIWWIRERYGSWNSGKVDILQRWTEPGRVPISIKKFEGATTMQHYCTLDCDLRR